MKTLSLALLCSIMFDLTHGHGYLADPPNRASRWRFGFPGPKEYTDNQLSCGGRYTQWAKHQGKCGACGDEYGSSSPRFVYPGKFATNPPIVKTYTEGELIEVTVKVTANHKGYFIFRVAPLVNPPIKQEDLDKHMLELENGDQEWTLKSSGTGSYTINLRLPKGLTCDHCVLQWWWTTGNNWNAKEPETFVNCADIKIVPSTTLPKTTSNPQAGTTVSQATAKLGTQCPPCRCPTPVVCPKVTPCPTIGRPAPPVNPPPASRCYAVSPVASNHWCTVNCGRGNCPSGFCQCT